MWMFEVNVRMDNDQEFKVAQFSLDSVHRSIYNK